MTDTTKTGGPAFPEHRFEHYGNGAGRQTMHGGMTLRDWFAGQAPTMPFWFGHEFSSDMDRFIAWRWAYADAMIAARGEA